MIPQPNILRGFVLAAALLVVAAGTTSAQQTLWTNAAVGNWTIGTNWNPIVPQSASIAEINNGGLAIINSPGAVADFLYLGFSGPRLATWMSRVQVT